MRPFQRKPGLPVVFKQPCAPGVGIVTSAAGTSESAAMHVLGFVTGNAVAGRRFEIGGEMTGFTRNQRMLPDEGESAQVVVKTHLPEPAVFRVTALTLFALPPLVYIIPPVAVITGGGQRQLLGRLVMALETAESAVPPS